MGGWGSRVLNLWKCENTCFLRSFCCRYFRYVSSKLIRWEGGVRCLGLFPKKNRFFLPLPSNVFAYKGIQGFFILSKKIQVGHALLPIFSLLSHSCVNNTRYTQVGSCSSSRHNLGLGDGAVLLIHSTVLPIHTSFQYGVEGDVGWISDVDVIISTEGALRTKTYDLW